MTREEYCKAMEQVTTTEGKKDMVWGNISEKMNSTKPQKKWEKRSWKYGMAVACFMCVVALSSVVTVFADDLKEFFHGFLKQEQNVEEYVEENVYEDSDGHVKVQVKELLSDDVSVQMTVKYEALDEEGKAWLKEDHYHSAEMNEESLLSLSPEFKENTVKYGVNGGSSYQELEKYRTDSECYYFVDFSVDTVPSFKEGIFSYMLPDGIHTTKLDISANVPVYEYYLQPKREKKLSKYYEPTYIRLSKLSYVVYGKNKGMYKKQTNGDYKFMLTEKQEEKEDIRVLSLIKNDGTVITLPDWGFYGGMLTKEQLKKAKGYDCLIKSNSISNFNEQLAEEFEETQPINPEKIVGVRISNRMKTVEYEFVRE